MYPPILEFNNISYEYTDGTVALKDISLTIEPGKKIALLGNNGAGKSTLFLHFNGILKAKSGLMRFKGEEFHHKRKEIQKLRQHVGIVFQDPDSQLFSASVVEDIRYGPRNMGLSKDQVEQAALEAMRLTETESLKDKPPHFLSIGQKKRVAIAGIVAMNPMLMVLDEPTAGLDPYYSKKIMEVLKNIQSEDRTIVISTHDVNLAYEWADEVIVMNNGRILKQGKPTEVFQHSEILKQSHLEKPWIMEVYEQITKQKPLLGDYPSNKHELFEIIKRLK